MDKSQGFYNNKSQNECKSSENIYPNYERDWF